MDFILSKIQNKYLRFFVLLLLTALLIYTYYLIDDNNIVDLDEIDYIVEADSFIDEFLANPATASDKYLETSISITGKIHYILKFEQKVVIMIQKTDDYHTVTLEIEDDKQILAANSLETGDTITIFGEVDRYDFSTIVNDQIIDIELIKCRLN